MTRTVRVTMIADFDRYLREAEKAATRTERIGAAARRSSQAISAFERDVDQLRTSLARLPNRTDVRVRLLMGKDSDVRRELRRLEASQPSIRIGLDTSGWQREAQRAARRLRVTTQTTLRVQIEGKFRRAQLQRELSRMHLTVRVTPTLGRPAGSPNMGGGGGSGGSGLRRGRLPLSAIAALASLAPQAVAGVSALTAATTALTSQLVMAASAGAALIPTLLSLGQTAGVIAIGTQGVGAAIGELIDEQTRVAEDAGSNARALRTAAQSVESAERSLGRARQGAADAAVDAADRVEDARSASVRAAEQASRTVVQALRQQETAEQSYADAQRDSKRAVDDLAQARRDAADDAEDLASQVRRAALDERQAVIDFGKAQAESARLDADSSATTAQRQEAQMALERATIALSDQRRESRRLREEHTATQRAGTEGSAKVKAAHEQVTQTVRAEAAARRDAADAADDTDRARLDGARAVADAQAAVADATLAQARTARDSADSVADAQRGLIEAQLAYAEAATAGGAAGVAAAGKVQAALAKLSPSQRAFVEQVLASREAFDLVRREVGETLFDGLDSSLRNLTDSLLPLLRTEFTDTARILNRGARDLSERVAGPLREDLGGALALNNDLILRGVPIIGDMISATLSLVNASGPLARRFMDAAGGAADYLDKAAQAGQESGRLEAFLGRAGDAAARLGRITGNAGLATWETLKVGRESGEDLTESLERLTERWLIWTRSVEGQQTLKAWFDEGRESASELGGLIGDIRREFSGFTENADFSDFVADVRDVVPYVADLAKSLTGSGEVGQQLAGAVLAIAEALDKLDAGGAVAAFLTTLSGIVMGIADIVQVVPGGTDTLAALAVTVGSLKAAAMVIGPLRNLTGALRGLTAASVASGGIGLALGILAGTFGAYSTRVASIERSIQQTYKQLAEGSTDAIADARRGAEEELDKNQALIDKFNSRNAFSQFIRPFENASVIAAKLRKNDLEATLRDAREVERSYYEDRKRLLVDDSRTTAAHRDLLLNDSEAMRRAIEAQDSVLTQAGISAQDTYAEMSSKLSAYRHAQSSANQASLQAAEDLNAMSDAGATATEQADALRRSIQRLHGGTMEAAEASAAFEASLDQITEGAKDNGKSLDETTAAGRANAQSIRDGRRALDEKLAAAKAAGAGEGELRRLLVEGAAALRKQTEDALGNTGQVKKMNDQLGLTPDKVETSFKMLGIDEATEKAKRLETQLRNLMTVPGMTPDVAESLAKQENAQAQRPVQRAAGGSVWGAGTATSDSIPALLSNGEEVIRTAMASGWRPFLKAINAGRLGSGPGREIMELFGLARGGTVSGSLALRLDDTRVDRVYGKMVGDLLAGSSGMEPGAGGSASGLLPIMAQARQYVMNTYGLRNIGGFARRNIAGTGVLSDHALGKAIDVMTTNRPLGDRIAADFAFGEAGKRFRAENVIWQQAISSRGRPFRGMADRGSPTQNHRDHVHIDTYARGGTVGRAGRRTPRVHPTTRRYALGGTVTAGRSLGPLPTPVDPTGGRGLRLAAVGMTVEQIRQLTAAYEAYLDLLEQVQRREELLGQLTDEQGQEGAARSAETTAAASADQAYRRLLAAQQALKTTPKGARDRSKVEAEFNRANEARQETLAALDEARRARLEATERSASAAQDLAEFDTAADRAQQREAVDALADALDREADARERAGDLLEEERGLRQRAVEAEQAYAEKVEQLEEQRRKAQDRYATQVSEITARQAKAAQDLAQQQADAAAQYAEQVQGLLAGRRSALEAFARIDEQTTAKWGASTSWLISNVREQTRQLVDWMAELGTVRARGLSEQVVSALGLDTGPEALQQLQQLNRASLDEIAALNAAVAERTRAADAQVQREQTTGLGELGRQLTAAAEQYAVQLQDLQGAFEQTQQDFAEQMREVQAEFAQTQQELADQLVEAQAELLVQQAEVATALAALGLQQGAGYGEALAEGLRSSLPGVQQAAAALQAAIAQVSAAQHELDAAQSQLASSSPAPVAGGVPAGLVHRPAELQPDWNAGVTVLNTVYVGDRELKDIIGTTTTQTSRSRLVASQLNGRSS